MRNKLIGVLLAVVGAFALGGIALQRHEPINALWIVTAAVCIYLLGYRVYAAWIASRVLEVDPTRATPAERLNNGRDFVPTHRAIVFGHHFAAIAGPGPLVGPTLAAQFGYLPGTLWILVGAVFGGCVQDMTILLLSTRRDGRSLGQMARDEFGPVGGFAALIGTLLIMVILSAVLGLVVVNVMKHSPWATATVMATIPAAIIVGLYLRVWRPGRVLEGTVLGVLLIMLALLGGGWLDHQVQLRGLFDYSGVTLAALIIGYGFCAAILPVWLLLAPRDYLSTFLKLGVVILLAIAIVITHPQIKMPAVTQFVDGTGPLFGGKVFPFVFITIACGAISGFHSLIASGTSPKLISNERDVRLVGYGSMALESFVAIMALIAATLLDPGVFFAINAGAGVVGATPEAAVHTIASWGFPVTVAQMQQLATAMGEQLRLDLRPGAPGAVVPLRHHVRSGVPARHARCRHARRPLHGAGPAGPYLRATGAHVLVPLGAALERPHRGSVGLLPLHRRHRSERRSEHPLAAVWHLQPDAGGDRAVDRDRHPRQERPRPLRARDPRAARLARARHHHRRLAEDHQPGCAHRPVRRRR